MKRKRGRRFFILQLGMSRYLLVRWQQFFGHHFSGQFDELLKGYNHESMSVVIWVTTLRSRIYGQTLQ